MKFFNNLKKILTKFQNKKELNLFLNVKDSKGIYFLFLLFCLIILAIEQLPYVAFSIIVVLIGFVIGAFEIKVEE